MRRLALVLVLVLGGCNRDDARTSAPPSTTPARTEAAPAPREVASASGDAAGLGDPVVEPDASTSPQPVADASPRVRLVDVDPAQGSLREQLVAAVAQAKADGRPVAVELWAGWCPPCKKLDKLLHGGAVAQALANAVLIRVDTDVFNEELNALGFDAPEIPSLYRVDERGKPKGKALVGAKWTRESETVIAAQLAAFLRG